MLGPSAVSAVASCRNSTELFPGGRGYGGLGGLKELEAEDLTDGGVARVCQLRDVATETEAGRGTRVLRAFYVTHELQKKKKKTNNNQGLERWLSG